MPRFPTSSLLHIPSHIFIDLYRYRPVHRAVASTVVGPSGVALDLAGLDLFNLDSIITPDYTIPQLLHYELLEYVPLIRCLRLARRPTN